MPRAMVFEAPGKPMAEVVYARPEPAEGEVLVRVSCCTLCRSDLHTHAGRRREATPTVLGHEVVGRIEALGRGVGRRDARGEGVREGDRVTWAIAVGCGGCFYCLDGLPQKCERARKYGHERVSLDRPLSGGLSDWVALAPGTAWFRLPDSIPDELGASANCATATAAAVVRASGGVAGLRVLVLGAGVLGLTVAAMSRVAGAERVMVSDPERAQRERAPGFGATEVCAANPAELDAVVREATQGRGADVVFELAGRSETVARAVALARTGGTVVLAGTVSPVGTVPLDPEAFVRRMLTLRGVHNYRPGDLAAALDFLAGEGSGFPWSSLLAARYPLAQAEEAFARAHACPGQRVAVYPG